MKSINKSPCPNHLPCNICGELIEIDKRYRGRTKTATHAKCQEKADGVEPLKFLKYLRENQEKIHEMWESVRSAERTNAIQ